MLEGPAPAAAPQRDTVHVLFLTHYDRIGAPSRYRAYQFFPRFRAARIEPEVNFLQSDAVCTWKNRGERRALVIASILLAYLRRMALLAFAGRRYPVWFVEKEIFPVLPFWVERLFIPRRTRIVVDYDDAVFLKYDRGGPLGLFCGGKIAKLMRRADVVFSGNPYITDYAKAAGARDVRWVPSVIDETRYRSASPVAGARPVVGWMGAYRNSRHIMTIAGALQRLARTEDFVLRIVGGGPIPLPEGIRVEYRPWSEEEEIRELQEFTVGIMPLVDGEWEKGKCGLKLIQYLAAGVPVVATPIGINATIVRPGVNGRHATTEDEWYEALREVLRERARGGFSAEQCVATTAEDFTIAALSPRLVAAIRGLGPAER